MNRRTAQTIAAAVLAVGALVTGVAPATAVVAGPSVNHPSDTVWD